MVSNIENDESLENDDSQVVQLPAIWGGLDDIPTLYANHLLITHTPDGEFFLVFGETATSAIVNLKTGDDNESQQRPTIFPRIKIAVNSNAMIRMAEVINNNVGRFAARQAEGDEQ